MSIAKKEKQHHSKKNAASNPLFKSDTRSLKDHPDGETICHADFSEGCLNEETDLPTMSLEDENEKY